MTTTDAPPRTVPCSLIKRLERSPFGNKFLIRCRTHRTQMDEAGDFYSATIWVDRHCGKDIDPRTAIRTAQWWPRGGAST